MRRVRLRNRRKYIFLDLVAVSGFLVSMTALLWMIHHRFDEHFAQSALVAVLGLLLGAFVAVILTPFTAEESAKWSNLTSAIVGAVAGYGIGFITDSVGYVFNDAHLFKGSDPGESRATRTKGDRQPTTLVALCRGISVGVRISLL